MEQHPIPQNVTTFQFRLIGDMTIKQFGYLAICAILAYVSYKLPLPIIISWPLVVLWVLLGIGLAFVPIEERPMDVWILSFIKSIYSPTQFVWQKSKLTQSPSQQPVKATLPEANKNIAQPVAMTEASALQSSAPTVSTAPLASLNNFAPPSTNLRETTIPIAASPPTPKTATTPLQESYHPTLQQAPIGSVAISPTIAPPSIYNETTVTPKTTTGIISTIIEFIHAMLKPTPKHKSEPFTDTQSLTGKHIDISKTTTLPPIKETEPPQAPVVPNPIKTTQPLPTVPQVVPEPIAEPKTIAQVLQAPQEDPKAFREKVERELAAIREHTKSTQQKESGPSSLIATDTSPTVRIVSPESASKAGLPRLTTFANVVTGIIKDSDSNLLPGVLVTIRDKTGMPVRALKSNKLGQIAASTPLSNGTYTVEVEDPRNRFVFDRAQITLSGAVMPPIEILAKSQKEVMRSKLEKEIFGNNMS